MAREITVVRRSRQGRDREIEAATRKLAGLRSQIAEARERISELKLWRERGRPISWRAFAEQVTWMTSAQHKIKAVLATWPA